MRKNSSIILLVLGVGTFVFGSYMSYEAGQKGNKISQAEENVEGRRKPLVGPVRKSVSARTTETAEEKIGEEKQKLGQSQVTANWLQGTGIVLFVLGLGYFLFGYSHKKRG